MRIKVLTFFLPLGILFAQQDMQMQSQNYQSQSQNYQSQSQNRKVEYSTQTKTSTTSILNNPFLNEQVQKLLEKAINTIIEEWREKINEEWESKLKMVVMKNKVEVLKLQNKIKELELKNKELEEKLKALKERKETKKLPIEYLKVNTIIKLGNKVILKTDKGDITEGSFIDNWQVIKIDLNKAVIYLQKGNNVIKVKLIMN